VGGQRRAAVESFSLPTDRHLSGLTPSHSRTAASEEIGLHEPSGLVPISCTAGSIYQPFTASGAPISEALGVTYIIFAEAGPILFRGRTSVAHVQNDAGLQVSPLQRGNKSDDPKKEPRARPPEWTSWRQETDDPPPEGSTAPHAVRSRRAADRQSSHLEAGPRQNMHFREGTILPPFKPMNDPMY
jgi:hypothetical protein